MATKWEVNSKKETVSIQATTYNKTHDCGASVCSANAAIAWVLDYAAPGDVIMMNGKLFGQILRVCTGN
jgi:hypothetical protein